MLWLSIALYATPVQPADNPVDEPAPIEEAAPSEDIDDCKDGVKDLKNDVLGLEFFLQDKKDYKTYCPYEVWSQPKLEVYKKKPMSYLPKNCKGEKI